MRPGFIVVLEGSREAKFDFFSPTSSLISFAQDSTTGITVALIGRIYYQDELKNVLSDNLQPDLNSNAILVLKLYTEGGLKSLEKLEGEFAIVIFDPNHRCLFALRDPLGKCPLYWAHHNQELLVSTNLQHLAQQIPQSAINRDFLASYLMFPYAFVELTTEQTVFKGIQRILPGILVALVPNGNPKKIWSWDWMARIQPIDNITPQEAYLQVNTLFRQSIQERVRGGKIASHLSGGMDSSSIVCIAQELLAAESDPRSLTTLSLVYKMRSLAQERDYIEMVLKNKERIEPHYVDGDAYLDFQWFPDKIPSHDEPYPALFHFPLEKVLVNLAAQLGVTTILSGGGAEVVIGENRMGLADLVRQGRWGSALKEARQWAKGNNQSPWSIIHLFGIEPLIPPLLREGLGTLLRGGYGSWPQLGTFTIPPWLYPDFAHEYDLWGKSLTTIGELQQHPTIEEAFHLMGLRAETGNWASWYLASPSDMWISHPFCDLRLITYCLGLPRELREVPGLVKPLLQEVMKNILPEPIRTRRFKANFNEVYWLGLSQNLRSLEDMITQSKISDLGIFDQEHLIKIIRQHAVGQGNLRNASQIGRSLSLIAWFEQLPN